MSHKPAIVAHRGACGYLPEHTLEAKALAYGQGADYLEQDVVATRDGALVVLHDTYLDDVTDVAARFPGRARDDGRHYVVDFDWAEIQQLELSERRRPGRGDRLFPDRFPSSRCGFKVASLDQEVRLVQGLNRSTGRDVGIYPEIKAPDWHHAHGIDLAEAIVKALASFGYESPQDRVYLQCFDASELRRVRDVLGCRLRLVRLLDADELRTMAADDWRETADYAFAVGVPYGELLGTLDDARGEGAVPLLERIRAAGLQLHPYTFRRDRPEAQFASFDDLLGFFIEQLRVDALFCDHPDIAVARRDAARA